MCISIKMFVENKLIIETEFQQQEKYYQLNFKNVNQINMYLKKLSKIIINIDLNSEN